MHKQAGNNPLNLIDTLILHHYRNLMLVKKLLIRLSTTLFVYSFACFFEFFLYLLSAKNKMKPATIDKV